MKVFNTFAFRSLFIFNYRLWAIGALFSNIGTWIQRTAQDWLVFAILTSHDASRLGLVMALQYAPQILFLPWTGLAADRLNQRHLLMLTQGLSGLLALGLGALILSGCIEIWHLYIFAFLSGIVSAVDAPVRQTFVAELVGDRDLVNGIALNSMSFNAGRFIGPACAGLMIAGIGTGWCFILNGVSFIAVLVSLFHLRQHELKSAKRIMVSKGAFRQGLGYVRKRPDLLVVLAMLFFIGTFGMNFSIFISAMGVDLFHTDAFHFGLLSSALAIGTIIGALINASMQEIAFRHLVTSAAGFALSCSLAALAPDYWTFALTLIFAGIAILIFTNGSNSFMQLSTTPEMRGRVMAIRIAITVGTTAIGAPATGWVADHIGPRWCIATAAVSAIIAVCIGSYYGLKHKDVPKPFIS